MSNPSEKSSRASPEGVAGGRRAPLAHPLLLAAGLAVLAFLFANLEIQIEGAAGWAANLPTWRIESHPLLAIFWGGKPLTGYHLWAFTFMAAVFHLPLVMLRTFTRKLEGRILGSVMVFWILEDWLWFVLNPAFGLARFKPDSVPWHKAWVLGLPTDYWVFSAVGLALIVWSFWPSQRRAGKTPPDNGKEPT